ncbi:DUF3034 family protein [Roseateles cellulosilyticus]|uniref:DUF3034 family protein n=1 Tax=Pelomonas cellulosilytica TaxID=2906762 RepID=A0ABS8XS04_9BURK|nr:DUF3034 family protein [Pelomonas sp. P8]MCE4554510.1 DUF3034 family protein [Pelomonas sp. P8]
MPRAALLLTAALLALPAWAGSGKLLLTGGVSSIDGAAGGGLTPWALTGSYATSGEAGATAFATRVQTRDYGLRILGAAVSMDDRVEFSIARQDLDTGDNLEPLGLPGLHLKLDILAVKARLWGDAVLDSDSLLPQLAIGLERKRTHAGALGLTLRGPLGARDTGTDLYVSATKLFLAPGVLANLTVRVTRANQNGLLGFGGAEGRGRRALPEVSLVKLLAKGLAVGVEFRAKPDNLDGSVLGTGALKEDNWRDLFVAWAPTKHVSLTAAWVDLGRIAPAVQPRRQSGGYLSIQFAL